MRITDDYDDKTDDGACIYICACDVDRDDATLYKPCHNDD